MQLQRDQGRILDETVQRNQSLGEKSYGPKLE